ncbi:MAG: hypothetical protein A3H45_00225 [Ignavibacteria bacterium RIFCSPLOWO2_02_FULL_55_14]|nr:MAG: hypothetical protein A3H45_00225 [Ignavibacteria bacterium RIFCSPLOWO2_02_FULL_55_14]
MKGLISMDWIISLLTAVLTALALFARQFFHRKTHFWGRMSLFDTGPGLNGLHAVFGGVRGGKNYLHISLQILFGLGEAIRG